jgi:hypothetical protein
LLAPAIESYFAFLTRLRGFALENRDFVIFWLAK